MFIKSLLELIWQKLKARFVGGISHSEGDDG